jgi:phosphoribosylformylglycinamidine synthase
MLVQLLNVFILSEGEYGGGEKLFAAEMLKYLGDTLHKFIEAGKPIIGICNGFQVLVKMGLLPGYDVGEQQATLTYNNSRRFECRWVHLKTPENSNCIWVKGAEDIWLPAAHGEGNFQAPDDLVNRMFEQGQVAYQYVDSEGNPTNEYPANPNGAKHAIAGISDESGLVFGLMPHPERYGVPHNHHLAPLQRVLSRPYIDKDNAYVQRMMEEIGSLPEEGQGLRILRNGVDHVVKNLL